jgi:predicted DNA-binding transcriptional regulator AlpA
MQPRILRREAAAAYVGVSPNTFDQMVKAGKMPRPKRITDRLKGFDRNLLDRSIDDLPTDGDDLEDNSWDDVNAT